MPVHRDWSTGYSDVMVSECFGGASIGDRWWPPGCGPTFVLTGTGSCSANVSRASMAQGERSLHEPLHDYGAESTEDVALRSGAARSMALFQTVILVQG